MLLSVVMGIDFPCGSGTPSSSSNTKTIFSIVTISSLVNLFLIMHDMVMEVVPKSMVSKPISTTSPCFDELINTISEMYLVTTFLLFSWHLA